MYKRIKQRKTKALVKNLTLSATIFLITLSFFTLASWKMLFHTASFLSPISYAMASFTSNILTDKKIEEAKRDLVKNNIAFKNVMYHSDAVLDVTLTDGAEVILSADKSIDQQISSLQLARSHFTIEGKLVKRLDFRFEKPVVVF